MDFEVTNYRHAEDILRPRTAWGEIREVISGISMDDIRAGHVAVGNVGRRTANQVETAGGQTAINKLFRDRFVELGWRKEPAALSGKEWAKELEDGFLEGSNWS